MKIIKITKKSSLREICTTACAKIRQIAIATFKIRQIATFYQLNSANEVNLTDLFQKILMKKFVKLQHSQAK